MKFLSKKGFTLVELLVVISIIGILAGVLLPNLLGIRERARDTKKKASLSHMKTALRLFYNDFQYYPESGVGGEILGCGPVATPENTACGSSFATTGTGGTTYMKELLETFNYTQTDGGDDFLLYAVLENASDAEITASVARCLVDTPVNLAYYVCQ